MAVRAFTFYVPRFTADCKTIDVSPPELNRLHLPVAALKYPQAPRFHFCVSYNVRIPF